MDFFRLRPTSSTKIDNSVLILFLIIIRFSFSYLNEHKSKHSLRNPLCKFDIDLQSTPYFLLRLELYEIQRKSLRIEIKEIDTNSTNKNNNESK